MSRAPYRSKSGRLAPGVPFTDAKVSKLTAEVLRNRYAALDPKEITQLRNTWNTRHAMMLAEQAAHDRNSTLENQRIVRANRHRAAQIKELEAIRTIRESEMEAARQRADGFDIFERLRLDEINDRLESARASFIAPWREDLGWQWALPGFLDEIGAVLRVTNPRRSFGGRSKEGPVVLIAEAALSIIHGREVSAEAIAKEIERIKRKRSSSATFHRHELS